MTSDMTSQAGGPVPGVPRTDLRGTVERFWATAEARDWTAFEGTPADDVVYTLPQTRERITGRDKVTHSTKEPSFIVHGVAPAGARTLTHACQNTPVCSRSPAVSNPAARRSPRAPYR